MSEFNREVEDIVKSDIPINPNVHNLKNTMCFKTWIDMIISLPNRTVKWCCKTQTSPEQDAGLKFDLQTLEEQGLDFFINHPQLKKRKYMLSGGERAPECSFCWKSEDASGSSVRTQYNKNFYPIWKQRLASATNHPKKAMLFNQQLQETNIFRFIELELTNKCNMACNYCWEGLSSRWQKEIGRRFEDTDDAIFNKVIELLNEYWSTELANLNPKAGVNFSLLGGEPFFTEHMYKFLEEFVLQIHDDIPEGYKFVVTVTTNMNFPQNKFDRFIELVKKTPKVIYDMQLSGEAVGRKSELVRWGQDFNKWNENLAQFMNVTKSIDNIYIGFGCAHNSLSLPYFKEFLQNIENIAKQCDFEKTVVFHTNWVDFPSHMAIAMVDRKHLSSIDEMIDYFENDFSLPVRRKDIYIEVLKTMRNIVDSDVSDEMLEKSHYEFEKLEQRRNISFAEHFPHYSELIKNPNN